MNVINNKRIKQYYIITDHHMPSSLYNCHHGFWSLPLN